MIASDNVEVNGRPVRKQQSFAALAVIGFEIPSAVRAIIDPQRAAFHGESRESIIVPFAERAFGSTITPTCSATTAREESLTALIDSY